MTTPALIVAGGGGLAARNLDDGCSSQVRWNELDGLFEPAQLAQGSDLQTFGGPMAVQAQMTAFVSRSFTLPIQITPLSVNGLNEGWQAQDLIAGTLQGNPSRIFAGSLYLDARFTPWKPTGPKGHSRFAQATFSGKATPPLWRGVYAYALGLTQGVTVIDDRFDQASFQATVTSGMFTWVNPGDAPTPLQVLFTLADASNRSTTVYLRNADTRLPRRIPINTDAAGNGVVTADMGLFATAGLNSFRFETSTPGTLVTGNGAVSLQGTVPRFLGNSSNRFNESPLCWTVYRQGAATYEASASALSSSGDGQARVGVPCGTYSTGKVGLILEQAATNILSSNQATCTDTTGDTTGFVSPDTSNVLLGTGGTPSSDNSIFYQGSRSLAVVVTNIAQGVAVQGLSASANSKYTFSCVVKTTAGVAMQMALWDVTNGLGTFYGWTSTGGWDEVQVTTTTGGSAVTDLRAAVRTNQGGGATFWTDAWQVEKNPFATSWVDGTRNADQAALWAPQNYAASSRDFSGWTAAGTGGVVSPSKTASLVAASDGLTWAQTWTITNVDNTLKAPAIPWDTLPENANWTWALRIKGGSMTGTIKVEWVDQAGTLIGAAQTVTLSTSAFLTVPVTCSPLPGTTAIYPKITTPSGTGTVYLEAYRVSQGSFPGLDLFTNGTAIPYPQNAFDQLGGQFSQNGAVRFTYTWAYGTSAPTGLAFNLFGDSGDVLSIKRLAGTAAGNNTVTISRSADGGVQSFTAALAIFDGNAHVVEVAWSNYTDANGAQHMYLKVYVDSALVATSSDFCVAAATTSWISGERLYLSDGQVYGVLSNISPRWIPLATAQTGGFPSLYVLPAGAAPLAA